MKILINIIIVGSPLFLSFLYSILNYYGYIDKITGRDLIQKGLTRLRSTKGYPTNFIYKNKPDDLKIFIQLEKIIIKNTKNITVKKLLKNGYKPKLIVSAGSFLELQGVPKEWPQHERFISLPNQPILFVYDNEKNPLSKGTKVCVLEELRLWMEKEKRNLEFWISIVIIQILSITIFVYNSLGF